MDFMLELRMQTMLIGKLVKYRFAMMTKWGMSKVMSQPDGFS
jgi:hypothetical protein